MINKIKYYLAPPLWFLLANAGVCLLASLSLLLLGLDEVMARNGLGWPDIYLGIFMLSSCGTLVMLLASKLILRYLLGARMVDDAMGTKVQQLQLIAATQARRAGIAPPRLAIYPACEMNAFALGNSRRRAVLVLSQQLLDNLSLDELSAVVGHEMTHVATGDMLSLSLMQGVVNMFVHFPARLLGLGMDKLLFSQYPSAPVSRAIALFLQLTLGGLASLLVMWFSRQREFRADAGGAQLAGHAEMMAALRCLQAGGQNEPAIQSFAMFGLNGHFMATGLWRLFTSHPSLAERIQALCKAG